MWAAYAGNFSAARGGVARELVELHDGRAPARCRAATIASIRSVDSPVPCSMQSMPGLDQARQHRLAEAVRGDPGAVLVGDLRSRAAKSSAGNDGARSPVSREIQSPTSLTQPSPRCASWATYAGRSSGSISWA